MQNTIFTYNLLVSEARKSSMASFIDNQEPEFKEDPILFATSNG